MTSLTYYNMLNFNRNKMIFSKKRTANQNIFNIKMTMNKIGNKDRNIIIRINLNMGIIWGGFFKEIIADEIKNMIFINLIRTILKFLLCFQVFLKFLFNYFSFICFDLSFYCLTILIYFCNFYSKILDFFELFLYLFINLPRQKLWKKQQKQ